MNRRTMQVCLTIRRLLMLFRFGGPALIFGATGPGPFGNRWVTEGRIPTLLLDADPRFFGAMIIGVGFVFFWAISKVQALRSVIYILAFAVALGAAARIYARIIYGDLGTAGVIPIAIEALLPVLIVFTLRHTGKDNGNVPK